MSYGYKHEFDLKDCIEITDRIIKGAILTLDYTDKVGYLNTPKYHLSWRKNMWTSGWLGLIVGAMTTNAR